MKAVLISINPLWCELIGNGEKTVEVSKNRRRIFMDCKINHYRQDGRRCKRQSYR